MANRNPFGHPDNCQCEACQDWRDLQFGLAALAELKKSKRTQADTKACGSCGRTDVPADANFCPFCGQKQ